MGARAFIPVALAGAVLLTLAPGATGTANAAEPKTEAQQIIKIAKAQRGDPWRYGATGPRAFDCSGLIIYSFKQAGDAKVIGKGKIRSARGLYRYFKNKGLADRKNPKPGDLVIWGGGTHVGIYIGNGKAISTLTSGVRIHGVHAVTASFTAYLHTGMYKKSTDGSTVAAKAKARVAAVRIGEDRVTDGKVSLRTGPGTQRKIITTLRDGTHMTVLAKGEDRQGRRWIEVKVGSRTGWVPKWVTD
jgi:hypothetical protein